MPCSPATTGAVLALSFAVLASLAGCYLPPLHHTRGAAEVAEAARIASAQASDAASTPEPGSEAAADAVPEPTSPAAAEAAPGPASEQAPEEAKASAAGAAPPLRRADVEDRLGRPGTLRKAGAWVYSWDQSFGYWFIPAYPSPPGGEITGQHLNVVVVFDGERVARYEWDADPPVTPRDGIDPPLPSAPDGPAGVPVRLALGDPDARCFAFASDLRRCLVALDAAGEAYAVAADGGRGTPTYGVRPRRPDPGWTTVRLVTPDDRFVLLDEPSSSFLWHSYRTQLWDLAAGTTRPVSATAAGGGGEAGDTSAAFGDGTGDPADDGAGGAADDGDGGAGDGGLAGVAARQAENDRALRATIACGGTGGRFVVVKDGRRRVRVLDTASWIEVARVEASVVVLGGALGGGRLAMADFLGSVEVFDLASGRREAVLRASGTAAIPGRAVALSADGRRLATASSAAIEVWDVDRLAAECAASPDGRIETTDERPTDALLGVALLPAHKRPPHAPPLALSPDGALVAAAARARLRVVRATGEHVAWLEAPADVRALRFPPSAPATLQAFTSDPFTPLTFDLSAVLAPRPRPVHAVDVRPVGGAGAAAAREGAGAAGCGDAGNAPRDDAGAAARVLAVGDAAARCCARAPGGCIPLPCASPGSSRTRPRSARGSPSTTRPRPNCSSASARSARESRA